MSNSQILEHCDALRAEEITHAVPADRFEVYTQLRNKCHAVLSTMERVVVYNLPSLYAAIKLALSKASGTACHQIRSRDAGIPPGIFI